MVNILSVNSYGFVIYRTGLVRYFKKVTYTSCGEKKTWEIV